MSQTQEPPIKQIVGGSFGPQNFENTTNVMWGILQNLLDVSNMKWGVIAFLGGETLLFSFRWASFPTNLYIIWLWWVSATSPVPRWHGKNKYGREQSELVMHLEMVVFFSGRDPIIWQCFVLSGTIFDPPAPLWQCSPSYCWHAPGFNNVKGQFSYLFRIIPKHAKTNDDKKQQCWSIDFSDFGYNLVPEMQEFSHCTLPTSVLLWFN